MRVRFINVFHIGPHHSGHSSSDCCAALCPVARARIQQAACSSLLEYKYRARARIQVKLLFLILLFFIINCYTHFPINYV
jgi:hypothetical protein